MGICFSKKKHPAAPSPPPPPPPPPKAPNEVPFCRETVSIKIKKHKKKNESKEEAKSPQHEAPPSPAAAKIAAATIEKKPVFVIAQSSSKKSANSTGSAAGSSENEEKRKEKASRKSDAESGPKEFVPLDKFNVVFGAGLPKSEVVAAGGAVRTSSCTKEEVDAILIQCGRLSRSSSGKASADFAGRKYSGSKRSYDFDNDEDWEQKQQQTSSRPSPRRRTPGRERSGSRERSSQRRVSRSPGRRSEGPAAGSSSSAAGCDKPKQQAPAKMVSVPATEKGVDAAAANGKRSAANGNNTAANRRNIASPRSRSPANTSRASNENAAAPQSLSRSNSRKAEQSPHRRNPMAEVDDNVLRGNNTHRTQKSREDDDGARKPAAQILTQRNKAKQQQSEPVIVEEEAAEDPKGPANTRPPLTRPRSSRRSSRDLDQILGGLNPDSAAYTSLLLEDIHNYHQQHASFSLPACVSKACSILEAVADLNSSSSDQSNTLGRRGLNAKEAVVVESEIAVEDDLMEPSLHKYVSVRDVKKCAEAEPQESAGSNSFVGGQPWATPSAAWELNSVDSTDRYWMNNGEEAEETSLPEVVRDFADGRGSRFRSGAARSGNSGTSLQSGTGLGGGKKRDVEHQRQLHRGGGGMGKGGGRTCSLPVVAAAASS